MANYFDKARARLTVFKRTRGDKKLPKVFLYVGGQGGDKGRRVIDAEGAEQVLSDTAIQSNYKIVSKADGKKLIAEYWQEQAAKPQEPKRKDS